MKEQLIKDDFPKRSDSLTSRHSHVYDEIKNNKGLIFFVLSNICFGTSNFLIKYFKVQFGDEFDPYSFNMWRNVTFLLVGYYGIKSNGEELIDVPKLNKRYWFLVRVSSNFITMISFIYAITYLRAATAQSINSMNPVLILVLSVFLLKEKFFMRYVIGFLVCFAGTLLIVMNDKKYHEQESAQNADSDFLPLLFGVFCAFISMVSISFLIVSNKILVKENISISNQIFYMGLSNFVASLVVIILQGQFHYNFWFIICSMAGGFIYYAAIHLQNSGLQLIDVSKSTPIVYISTLTVFIEGVFFLGETVFFTDILGSLLILAFNLYNTYYPIKH